MLLTDRGLGEHCQLFVTDILTQTEFPKDRWQTIESEQTELTDLRRYLDGTLASLQASAAVGCHLCLLIADGFQAQHNLQPTATFTIFVWGRSLPALELKVCTGDPSRFLGHVSTWQQPFSLKFFRRNADQSGSLVTTTNLPCLLNLPFQKAASQGALKKD